MICTLMMGRAGSTGFPNKNIKKVLGRCLFEYPLLASKNSQNVDKIFVTTDCPVITRVSKKYGAIQIKRPNRLAHSKALGEEVFQRLGHPDVCARCRISSLQSRQRQGSRSHPPGRCRR